MANRDVAPESFNSSADAQSELSLISATFLFGKFFKTSPCQTLLFVFILLFIFLAIDIHCSLTVRTVLPLRNGYTQGTNFGPFLFLVYINDLPNCLSSVSPRMYADDTNLTFATGTIANLICRMS